MLSLAFVQMEHYFRSEAEILTIQGECSCFVVAKVMNLKPSNERIDKVAGRQGVCLLKFKLGWLLGIFASDFLKIIVCIMLQNYYIKACKFNY